MEKEEFIKKKRTVFLILVNLSLVIAAFLFAAKLLRFDILGYVQGVPCRNCNVVFITIDVLGSRHLPCYGYKKNTAPNLCKLAEENIIFKNSFANAPWTLPSQFSIFTSQYPKHHGIENLFDENKIGGNVSTLPKILKDNGYRTLYVGDPDSTSMPLKRGIGIGFQSIINSKNIDGWKDGFKKLLENDAKRESTFLFIYDGRLHSPYGGILSERENLDPDNRFSQVPLTREKLGMLSKDFYDFILGKYKDPKDPNVTVGKRKMYNFIKEAGDFNVAKRAFDALKFSEKFEVEYDYYDELIKREPGGVDYVGSLYDKTISYIDEEYAELISFLADKELANDTILVVTSQHGEEFMEHGNLQHPADDLKPEVTEVPLIMYLPGVKKRNINAMVQGIDIAPTILFLVGITKPSQFEGISFADMILNRKNPATNGFVISQGINIDSIRTDKWKLYIQYHQGRDKELQLYDLETDPDERRNVILQYPSVIKKLSNDIETKIYKESGF